MAGAAASFPPWSLLSFIGGESASPAGLRQSRGPGLFEPTSWAIEPQLFRKTDDESRHPPGLSHRQGRHDRRNRVHHPHDLGQVGRHAAPRHRPEVASGLDRRPAASARPWRAGLALSEKGRRAGEEGELVIPGPSGARSPESIATIEAFLAAVFDNNPSWLWIPGSRRWRAPE